MLYFILSLMTFSAILAVYIRKTRRWTSAIYLLLFSAILGAILIYSLRVRPYSARGIEAIYKEIILFASMLLGMITSTVSEKIRGRKISIKLTDILKSLFVAPIIFLVIWGAIEKMVEFNFITCCFAYTNGYFWKAILKTVKSKIVKQSLPSTKQEQTEKETNESEDQG